MSVININNLTKDYGNNKGIFDLSFKIEKGEAFGFLGPNGAGKTTTIRHLLGFLNPDMGDCTINGLDCRTRSAEIEKSLGYLPGEIAFLDEMKGIDFLKFLAELKGMKDFTKMNELISFFELDPSGRLKKMSKGMKQKIGIVSAFMDDPDVLILDEPTSGLDPLMQSKFVELIDKEKKASKTILMSSHSFEEVEKTCDRVGIIKNGRLVTIEEVATLKSSQRKQYIINFTSKEEAERFSKESFDVKEINGRHVTVSITGHISPLIKVLADYEISSFDIKTQSLEDIFMHYYGGDKNE